MAYIANLSENEDWTDGANDILSEVRDTWDDHDPWGSGMNWLFPLADVFFCITGETLPDYHPAAGLRSFDDLDMDDYQTETLVMMYAAGQITKHDIACVFTFLSELDDIMRELGLNY